MRDTLAERSARKRANTEQIIGLRAIGPSESIASTP